MIGADGASHKRQRKSISPGFTTVKIREYSATFQNCAQKVRKYVVLMQTDTNYLQLVSKWESGIDSSDDFTADLQKWFGAYSLVHCCCLIPTGLNSSIS